MNFATKLKKHRIYGASGKQITGVEPAFPAWEASVIPIDHICNTLLIITLYTEKSRRKFQMEGDVRVGELVLKYNELTAEEFISLWKTVWEGAPSLEQTELAMDHTLFRVSVYDGDYIVAMARMIGDMGLNYYIKDVVVRPDYQRKGIGRMLISELIKYINDNGISNTDIFVELCAMPDKIPFYEKLGFSANEAQRLKIMKHVE